MIHRSTLALAASLLAAATVAEARPEYSPLPEAAACQEQVREQFLRRNRDLDVELAFPSRTIHEDVGPHRERISGRARVDGAYDPQPVRYECVVNMHTNRVLTARYDVVERPRDIR